MASSSVPIIPQHKPDDIVLAIEALRDRAEADGTGTLAYLLDIARAEAVRISQQARHDRIERRTDPKDLWRPMQRP